jgi:hypothetical protein
MINIEKKLTSLGSLRYPEVDAASPTVTKSNEAGSSLSKFTLNYTLK